MLAILRIDGDGRVVAQDAAAEALLGRCVGRRCCDTVSATANRSFLCLPHCSATLLRGEATEGEPWTVVTIRGQLARLRCVPVGSEVVVVIQSHEAPTTTHRELLTPRERQVLQLAAAGASTAQIARQLAVSPATIRTHADRARQKLGARTRAQAVALGLLSGEIEPG